MNMIEYSLKNMKELIEHESGLKLEKTFGAPIPPRIYFENSPYDEEQEIYHVEIYFNSKAANGDGELFLLVMEGDNTIIEKPVGQLPMEETISEFVQYAYIGVNAE